jgi:hypothetical protein
MWKELLLETANIKIQCGIINAEIYYKEKSRPDQDGM